MSVWTVTILLAVLLALELVAPIYLAAMRRAAAQRSRPAAHGASAPGTHAPPLPHVTVFVATYNEESTIRTRLRNLRGHDYPAMDVVVVDAASTDKTRELIRAFQTEHPGFPIRLVEEAERRGKVVALREALPLARAQLVCITDADCVWEPGALRAAVERFGEDERIGAVTGLQSLMDGSGLAQEMERGYNRFYNTLRLGESALDSTPILRGELTVFRRDLVAWETWGDEAPCADDSEIAMKLRRQGHRAVVEPLARFREFAPPTLAARRKQKARRGAGLLQLFTHNARLCLQPWRYGWFSLICFANLSMLLLAPLATVALLAWVPFLLWTGGGPLLLVAGVMAFALVLALARLAPRTPAALAAGYLQSHFALLASIALLVRPDPRWEPIAEVRDRWRNVHEA